MSRTSTVLEKGVEGRGHSLGTPLDFGINMLPLKKIITELITSLRGGTTAFNR